MHENWGKGLCTDENKNDKKETAQQREQDRIKTTDSCSVKRIQDKSTCHFLHLAIILTGIR